MLDRKSRTPDSSPHLRTYPIRTAAELRDYARTLAFDNPVITDPNSPQDGTFKTGNRQIEYLFVPPDTQDAEAPEHTLVGPPNALSKILIAPRIAASAHVTDFHLFADQIARSAAKATHVHLNSSNNQGVYAKVGEIGPRAALHLGPHTLADVRTVSGAISAHSARIHVGTLRPRAHINAFDGTRLTVRHLNAGSYVHLFGNSQLYLPNGCESTQAITLLNGHNSTPILYLPADKLPPGFNHSAYPNVVVLSGSISQRTGEGVDDFKQKGTASDGTVEWVPLHRIDHKKVVAFELG